MDFFTQVSNAVREMLERVIWNTFKDFKNEIIEIDRNLLIFSVPISLKFSLSEHQYAAKDVKNFIQN